MEKDINVREMTVDDVDHYVSLVEPDGWNVSNEIVTSMMEVDKKGFFVAEVDGKRVGYSSGVRFGENFGCFGNFFVQEEYRSKGIGRKLLKRALEHLEIDKGERNLFLNGREHVLEMYKRKGFKVQGLTLAVYQGILKTKNFQIDQCNDITVQPGNTASVRERLMNYLIDLSQADITSFWESVLTRKGTVSFCALKEEKIVGFAAINKIPKGFRIAPLYAETPQVAKVLLKKLSEAVTPEEDGYVVLDGIEPNIYIKDLMDLCNLKHSYSLFRVCTLADIPIKHNSVYACGTNDVTVV